MVVSQNLQFRQLGASLAATTFVGILRIKNYMAEDRCGCRGLLR